MVWGRKYHLYSLNMAWAFLVAYVLKTGSSSQQAVLGADVVEPSRKVILLEKDQDCPNKETSVKISAWSHAGLHPEADAGIFTTSYIYPKWVGLS